MPQEQLNPFFIVGQALSGTSLLRYILSSHPDLHVPAETGFIPFLPFAPGHRLSPAEMENVIGRIEALNVHWQGLVGNFPDFYRSLSAPTIPYLLDKFYRRQIARHNVEHSDLLRWGDKTPGYVNYIPQLAAIFPRAQFGRLSVTAETRCCRLSRSGQRDVGIWTSTTC